METAANLLRFAGLVVTFLGLWWSAGGLRVIVSGRLDERHRSVHSLKWGLPLLAVGLALLIGGTCLVNWIRVQ